MNNTFANYIFSLIIQIMFMLIFIILFFFLYVIIIEKQVFVKDMNDIVTDLLSQIDLNKILPSSSKQAKNELIILVSGLLTVEYEKLKFNNTDTTIIKNTKLINNISKIMIIVVGIILIISISLLLIGFNLNVSNEIKKNFMNIIFIGITEFLFLNIIVVNYRSTDPNNIKVVIAQVVQNYIKNRQFKVINNQ